MPAVTVEQSAAVPTGRGFDQVATGVGVGVGVGVAVGAELGRSPTGDGAWVGAELPPALADGDAGEALAVQPLTTMAAAAARTRPLSMSLDTV